jgi:hypothetical protein
LLCSEPRTVVEEWAMTLLRKGDKRVGGGSVLVDASQDPLVLAYPVLWAFLTQTAWEDGSQRQPGSLLMFTQDGMMKCMLRDREDGTCLWVAGRGLTHLLDVAEGSLCDPGADWRVDRQQPGQKAQRVTKGR